MIENKKSNYEFSPFGFKSEYRKIKELSRSAQDNQTFKLFCITFED